MSHCSLKSFSQFFVAIVTQKIVFLLFHSGCSEETEIYKLIEIENKHGDNRNYYAFTKRGWVQFELIKGFYPSIFDKNNFKGSNT